MNSFLKQINESFQALDEKDAKPDYLDFDGDGDKEEAMTKALKDKEQNEDVDSKADLDNDGELSSWEAARKDAIDKAVNEDEIEEASTSAGAGAYMTKNFVAKRKQTNPNLKQSTGYTDVPKTKLHTEYDYVQEAMDRKYEQLIEGYRDFALGNAKLTSEQKVKKSIREVAKQLKEIEQNLKFTNRLKQESGIHHSGFSEGTTKAITKISERLIKISERVRSLGE
jgi:hypothetical protein